MFLCWQSFKEMFVQWTCEVVIDVIMRWMRKRYYSISSYLYLKVLYVKAALLVCTNLFPFGISTIHWNCVSRKSSVLLTTHVSSLKVSEQYNYHKHRRLIGSYSIKWKKNKCKLSDTFGCLKNLLERTSNTERF